LRRNRFARIMHNSSGLAADGRPAAPESHAQAGAPGALPFAHLNLRRNPFGEFQPAQRAVLAVAEVERFVRRLAQPGYAVQFIGDQGRGKTTHLLAIMRHFPRAAYVHVGQGQRPPIPQIRIATAEQLIERFGDNVRAIESYLYDLFQELPGIRDV
jgi:hypothetical protein